MTHIHDEWKPVIGFEEYYQVSGNGQIRRIKAGGSATIGKCLKPSVNQHGYLQTVLCGSPGIRRTVAVHRVVADSFLGPRLQHEEINHIDGNKLNNSVRNLEIVTASQNSRHAIEKGIRGSTCKLRLETAISIRLSPSSVKASELADRHGVSEKTINHIRSGRRWSWAG